MATFFYIFSQIIFLFGLIFFALFLVYSIFEKEKHAALRTIPGIVILILLLGVVNSVELPGWVFLTFSGWSVIAGIVVIIPFGNSAISIEIPKNKFDERDIMFSRMELKKDTSKFNEYYKNRPQNQPKDDLFRQEPGLLNSESKFYHPLLFNAAAATFSTVDLLQPLTKMPVQKNKTDTLDTDELSAFIRSWAKKLGAVDVGFTLVKPHHTYSHAGRGENYGREIHLQHKFAIAFTVEMNHESMSYAPRGPIIMESAQQYLNAGAIAVQIAQFIRNLGFEARAHIDANYQLICPVVAQDAGLGTIGRMGLLIAPKLGPRVRIGVVTTNLKVEINEKPIDSTVIQFCEICKKCATTCPSNAISPESGKKQESWKRWKIDHEKCFTYWCKIGTDCGRCITVCPFSHPNNFMHNIIRWTIRRNSANRWIALKLDDYFYGRKPGITPLKSWMGIKNN